MNPPTSKIVQSWDAAMRFLRNYHSYEVVGLDQFPRSGPALVASTHSLATYENFLLGSIAVDELGRRPYILADDLLFRIPWVGDAFREVGVVPGKRDTAIEILKRGDLLGLGPGGMREGLRSSKDKYQFDWAGRYGFVWVSLLSGAPIVLAACPSADDVFTVYETSITAWIYKQFHFPLPFFRGLGPSVLPRPVKLWHVMSEPIFPPVEPDKVTEDRVMRHHEYVTARMHQLMQKAVAISS